ncbi:MAG TPA: protein kinase [Bryobacteraceae bacterium]|jgi:non-specific serine/threonine protein kinase/serine/threonine-protein kinase
MISPDQHRRLKDLVEAALERPSTERSDYLSGECSTEPELLREAEDLLAVYSDADPTPEPERIGPYRLIEEIGAGGMGVVHLAEREGGYHRKVAIKVLRRGMDTDFFLARFFKEREILGAMDHPGVVRIVDAGSTVDGRPYLVMDYVDGIRIDRYCEQNQIPVNERLKIFIKVCQAVQHAHRNLIVHRDLKPGNILVTPEGEPKLLDFGIAKVIDENEERTQLTIPIMTRQYASPEQVLGKRITTSCDIYALGLILYEMLTSTRPYDLKDKPVDEVERLVCKIDPPPPSSTVTEHTTRYTLRGDLDRIVMMALRKEPERRYGSVEAMTADLIRYLDGRPVSAQRDTWHYRAGKFLQRNRNALMLASVIAATILGGTVGIVWQASIARAERARGERVTLAAEARLASLREFASSTLFDLQNAIHDLPGSTDAQRLLLDRAIKYSDQLAAEAGDNPKLLSEVALVDEHIGLLENVPASALQYQQKALEIRQRLVTTYPAETGYKRDLAISYVRLAELDHLMNRPDQELAHARQAIQTLGASAEGRDTLASAYRSQASALMTQGDLSGALAAATARVDLLRKMELEHPTDITARVATAEALEQQASILERQGNRLQARQLEQANTAVFEQAVAWKPNDSRFQRLLKENRRAVGMR